MPRFGAFEVRTKLGSGGLADVFGGQSATEGGPEGPLALKVLRDDRVARSVIERFLREGRLLMRYPHPNLPVCHGLAEEPRPTIVLERLDGESLAEAIRRGPMPVDDVNRIAHAMLGVLTHLHQHGVAHRDVKPGNIQLTSSGRVVLMDLGLAHDPEQPFDVRRGEVLGTYAYMAPEQIAGAGADHRADLYGLGLTLYEALAGKHPYTARGAAQWLRAHTHGGAPGLDGAPPRLVALIEQLMDRDPAGRPQTATLALAALTGHHDHHARLHPPKRVGRDAAIGALQGALDEGTMLVLVGERASGTALMARMGWRLAQERGLSVVGARCNARGKLQATVERGLGGAVSEGAALIVEDLHRASPAELRWLSGLTGVPILATSEREVPLRVRSLPLRDLTVDEVQTLVASMLGGPPPPGFAEQLHAFTGGLPAAVVLTVRDYFDRGALVSEGRGPGGLARWRAATALRMSRDSSLELIWGRKLDQLADRERRVLEILAVASRPLPIRICSKVSGVNHPLALHRLQTARLATVRGEQVQVARPAIGALVACRLSPKRRGALHGALAMALLAEEAGPWREELLSWHMAMGAESHRAAKALVGFAARIREAGRPEEALKVLLRVQAMDVEAPTALRTAMVRGQVMLDLSRADDAGEALGAARRLAESLEDENRLRQVKVLQARVGVHRGLVEPALELADELLKDKTTSEALLVKGTALMLLGRGGEAVEALQEVVERAEAGSSAAAMGGLGSLAVHAGRFGVGIRQTSQQVRYLRREGPQGALVDALVQLGLLHALAGDIDQCGLLMSEATEVARAARLSHLNALAGIGRARLALTIGDLETVESLLQRYVDAARTDGSILNRVQWHNCRLELTLARGDDVAALATANRLLELSSAAHWQAARAYYAGLVAALRGDHRRLEDAADELTAYGDTLRRGRLWLHAARTSSLPEHIDRAVEGARSAGDVFLRLEALHLSGGGVAAAEARLLAFAVVQRSSGAARDALSAKPAIVWALTTR